MKVITEAVLRNTPGLIDSDTFILPEGKLLSPSAREYLSQKKIKIVKGCARDKLEEKAAPDKKDEEKRPEQPGQNEPVPAPPEARFIDEETGAFYTEKPENMTHLHGNILVVKNHPRIAFRGKLDSLQARLILYQTMLMGLGENPMLIQELGDVLGVLREIMRCDVLNEPFNRSTIIGLNHAQLREQSHDPMKFYKIKQMVLPDKDLGQAYALLNDLRTGVRETEIAAIDAYADGKKVTRGDIVEGLNRLSSAMHIIMCKYLANYYQR